MHGLYRGPQDETEFRRLGMCEARRHILEDPSISVYVKWTQCASLTYSGLQMAERLVILSQVRGATHATLPSWPTWCACRQDSVSCWSLSLDAGQTPVIGSDGFLI